MSENSNSIQEPTITYDKETFVSLLERKTDQFVIWSRELSSRGTSFLIAMLGVILQASHTTLLMYSVSGFESNALKLIVALGLGIFISSALAIFTIKHDGTNAELGKIILIFFYFEIFSNLFYYFNSLIFDFVDSNFGFGSVPSKNWLYLIICLPFAYIVPFTIKQFSGMITADKKLKFGSIDDPNEVKNKEKFVDESLNIISEKVESITEKFTEKISDVYGEIESQKMGLDSMRDAIQDLNKTALKQGQAIKINIDETEHVVLLQKDVQKQTK